MSSPILDGDSKIVSSEIEIQVEALRNQSGNCWTIFVREVAGRHLTGDIVMQAVQQYVEQTKQQNPKPGPQIPIIRG